MVFDIAGKPQDLGQQSSKRIKRRNRQRWKKEKKKKIDKHVT